MLPEEPEVVLKRPEVTRNLQLSYILLSKRLKFVCLLYFKACSTGMMFTMADEMRPFMPKALMGCQLFKVPINKLVRAKLTSVLKTADAHSDIIVNCEEHEFERMNMANATKKWEEICDSMDWECKDFLIVLGGTGKIFEPIRSFKTYTTSVKIDDLQDPCPILVDNDWFEKLAELGNKKRSLSEVGWSEESMLIPKPKKPETETRAEEVTASNDSETGGAEQDKAQSPDLNATLEEFQIKAQEMLEEQKQKADETMKQLVDYYEKRIKNLQEHSEFVSRSVEGQIKENDQVVDELKNQLKQQEHEKMMIKKNLTDVQNQVQNFNNEKREWQIEMAKLRDMIMAQNSLAQNEMKQEPNVADITFGTVKSDMDSDEDTPKHSSPCRSIRRINTVSKGVPTSLGKLGMTVFNPLKHTKIEYLCKFAMMVEDFTSAEDFKQIKQLIYQAFADDKNFRIQDLTSDDKSSLQKLAKAIVKQDGGDSIDLMRSFDSQQLKHGETHLNYLHRVSVVYEFAANFADSSWKTNHIHAQKIYNKIDDSLPTAARSKFRELMMDKRKKSAMTFDSIKECLDTVLLIYGDEIKLAMGSQRHVLPMVDAIQSKPRSFSSKKKEVVCFKCGEVGHMKRFCPQKGNNREPKTTGRRNPYNDNSRRCFICNGLGHFARGCPNKQNEHGNWSQGTKNDQ